MKYIDICKKWLNLFHLISTFSDVLTSGFPSFHILSILANCFASKFSDLLTFINFMFPTFTQFEKWTVKKSNFDSFQKVIFHSLPVVGLSMKYFYTILLPLNLVIFQKSIFFFKTTVFSMLAIFSNLFKFWTSNPPRPPLQLIFIAFLSYKFSKFPKTLSKTLILQNILFSSNQKMVKWLNKW